MLIESLKNRTDSAVWSRGVSYFKNGSVRKVVEVDDNKFEAIVVGSDKYKVRIKISNGDISKCSCNCPYDYGGPCKHIVALALYIDKNFLKIESKKDSKSDIVDRIFEKISLNEIKNFLKDVVLNNKTVKERFLKLFDKSVDAKKAKDYYIKQIVDCISSELDSYDYLSEDGAYTVNDFIDKLFEDAKAKIVDQDYETAFNISIAVIETVYARVSEYDEDGSYYDEYYEYAEDRSSDLEDNIDKAFQIIDDIILNNIDKNLKQTIMEYFTNAIKNNNFEHDSDIYLSIFNVLKDLIENIEELEAVFKIMNNLHLNNSQYESLQCSKYYLIKQFMGEEKGNQFLEENLNNVNIFFIYIKNLIEQKNYEKAKSILKKSINSTIDMSQIGSKSKKERALESLLEIAELENSSEDIIKYAKELFLFNNSNNEAYHNLLKSKVASEKWIEFLNSLIELIKSEKHNESLITTIYIRESWWDKLFDFVKTTQDIYIVERFENYLLKDYSSEIAEIYYEKVKNYLKDNIGRDYYKTACKYIKKVAQFDSQESAEELIDYLKKMYPSRRALKEELQKIKW